MQQPAAQAVGGGIIGIIILAIIVILIVILFLKHTKGGGMSALGNLIWFIFGGLLMGIHYVISGLALCITIIGIPFGLQAIKLAQLSLMPFGKEVVEKEKGSGCLATFMNILWLLTFGLLLALHHLLWAIIFGISIIGIPFAKQHLKLAGIALLPFGKEVRG